MKLDNTGMYAVGSAVWFRETKAQNWIRGTVSAVSESSIVVKTEDGEQKEIKNHEKDVALVNTGGAVEDMVTLTYLHEPGVLSNLEMRYQQSDIYTYTGSILIAVNPFMKMPHLYGHHMMEQYKDADQGELSPHAYAIADVSYRQMRKGGKSQAILVSGESGAGKTETSKHIMQYLAWLGGELDRSTLEKDQKIEQKVLESNPLLEAFGNAKTIRNDNSSRFGKFTEIQFDDEGRISGAAIRTYLLERSRVVNVSDPERNYHIFYQLCDGATDEERKLWKLKPAHEFAYLSSSSCFNLNNVDNAAEYNKTRTAMSIVGIPEERQEAVLCAVAAVLHLGNIVFEAVDEDEAQIKKGQGEESLSIAADLLGVPVEGLKSILISRTRQTPDGPITSPISMEAAIDTRNSFAKSLYSRIFDWLVGCINESIGQDQNPASLIGVLDIYGFEEFQRNDFEQFCINLANEKLQQHFNQHVFKMEQAQYEKEEIVWSYIEFVDNQDVLDLIEGFIDNRVKVPGIFDLLDETCKFPRFTHHDFSQKLESSDFVKNSIRIRRPKLSRSDFIIDHYAGSVHYTVTNFLDKNKDFTVVEQHQLLSESSNTFFRELYPPLQDTGSSSFKFTSVSSRFKKQLGELMYSLESMEPHYIRCIKPNKENKPMEFDNLSVTQQLRCGGVLEAVRISCAGYPSKYTYEDFNDHFWMLAQQAGDFLDAKNVTKHIVENCLRDSDTQYGKTKVFLRAGSMAELEKSRMKTLNNAAIVIQTEVRGFINRHCYRRILMSILLIQCSIRQWIAKKKAEFKRNDMAAIRIQKNFRSFIARKDYLQAVEAITKIQAVYRCYAIKKYANQKRENMAVATIQSCWRSYVMRSQYISVLEATLLIQATWRMRLARLELVRRSIDSKTSKKLIKDKETLQRKVENLEVLIERVKNQRDDLRSEVKELKMYIAAKEVETSNEILKLSEEAKESSLAGRDAIEKEINLRKKLQAEIDRIQCMHKVEELEFKKQKKEMDSKVEELQLKVENLEACLGEEARQSSARISELDAALMKAIKQRDAAREEAQFAAANMNANSHDISDSKRVMIGNGADNRTPVSKLSPAERTPLANTDPITDMDKRQRDLHAKQQQLIREQRSAGQERLVLALKSNLGFHDRKPIAAVVIFRSCIHWKAIQAERGGFFDKIIETIGKEIESHQDDDMTLGYWLSNTVCLYYLMQRYTKPGSESGITARLRTSGQQAAKGLLAYFSKSPNKAMNNDISVQGGSLGIAVQFEAKYPALLFKQQSVALVQKLFPMLRDNIKKDIQGCINTCINVPKIGRSTSRKDDSTMPWKKMLHSFNSLLEVLKANFVPSLLSTKAIEQLFQFVNVQFFNHLLLKRESCSFSNGEYVKMGLSEVEAWTDSAGKQWVGNSWGQLAHIRQAVTFLVIHQKSKKTLNEIMNDLCPDLTVQQLYRISTMYWDDRYQTETVSHEVLAEMKKLMIGDSQRNCNHQFLLDDDTSIPFSQEELSASFDEIDLLDGIKIPDELVQTASSPDGGFSFLERRLKS